MASTQANYDIRNSTFINVGRDQITFSKCPLRMRLNFSTDDLYQIGHKQMIGTSLVGWSLSGWTLRDAPNVFRTPGKRS